MTDEQFNEAAELKEEIKTMERIIKDCTERLTGCEDIVKKIKPKHKKKKKEFAALMTEERFNEANELKKTIESIELAANRALTDSKQDYQELMGSLEPYYEKAKKEFAAL